MKTARLALALMALSGLFVLSGDEADPKPVPYIKTVLLEGIVDDGMYVVVSRAVKEAEGAEALIFVVDTPGGRVDAALNITNSILDAPCKTIAYVDGMGAISAGALISYACDEIAMSPTTNMGAAQPVTFSTEGMEPLGEKETSFVRAKFAALAEAKGRNPYIAMAMVDKDVELRAYPKPDGTYEITGSLPKQSPMSSSELTDELASDPENAVKRVIETILGQELPAPKPKDVPPVDTSPTTETAAEDQHVAGEGIIIDPRGKLLTLTPKEAQKYGVIKHIAEDLEQLQWQLGYTGMAVVDVKPTWSEALYRWLISPEISALLLLIGIGGLYIEFKTPGFGVAGTIGIAALVIYFGARSVVGLSDWIDILLVVIGVALVMIEILVLPGFGFVGAVGFALLFTGIVLSFTYADFQFPTYSWEWHRIEDAGVVVTVTTISLIVLIIATWKLLPRTPLYRHVVLQDQQLAEEGWTVQSPDAAAGLVGQRGVATSMLRPAGRARFGHKTLQVVSRAEFIEEGTPVKIVEVEGNRYVVDPE